jgi:FkbM family methyltransferase
MVSYAQNCEDVLLQRLFAEVPDGFYIDVGAGHPVRDSVTKHFYERGWHGINIEPAADSYQALCADRPRDINLNLGLSNREATLTFYEAPARPGWSTFSPELGPGYRRDGLVEAERQVAVTTLAQVCARYADRAIDFLKIDVEGYEREVLEGADWQRWRPRALVIESNYWERWEPLLLAADYRFAFFDGLNRFYVRAEDAQLLPLLGTPANCLDDFDIHRYVCRIESLRRRLLVAQESSSTVVLRLRRASRRFPRCTAAVKRLARWLRLAGGPPANS